MSRRASRCWRSARRSELLDRLRIDVLLEAAAEPDSALGRALGDRDHAPRPTRPSREVIGEAIRQRDEIDAWIARAGGVRRRSRSCRARSASSRTRRSRAIAAEFFSGLADRRDRNGRPSIAALDQGSKSDKEHAARFDALRLLDGSERIKAYLSIFCTAELRAAQEHRHQGASATSIPALFQRLLAEQERVCALIARRRAVETRDRTAALVTIAAAVIARYRAEKDRRGLLDYDDLIDKTLASARQRVAPPGCTTSSISASTTC